MLTKEELKNANNNVITIMENRVMQMTGCSRATANLVVNEILDLDEESLKLWEELKAEKDNHILSGGNYDKHKRIN